MPIPINLVYEDAISETLMLKILQSFGDKYYPENSYPANGFGYIKSNINGFNQASVATTFFILTDLDTNECPATIIDEWIRKPLQPNLIFRVVVKEVEAWLLADIEGFSKYLGISEVNFPDLPELENDPKITLINLVKKSKKRKIKEDIIPLNDNAKIGPNYNEQLMEYIIHHWDLERAINRAPSLKKTYCKLARYNYIQPE